MSLGQNKAIRTQSQARMTSRLYTLLIKNKLEKSPESTNIISAKSFQSHRMAEEKETK